MFGLGWTEILVIAAIAVLVVPTKDLPGLMRSFGQGVGKMRRMATQFQRELDNAVRDEEIDKLRKEMSDVSRDTEQALRRASGQKELQHIRKEMAQVSSDTNRELRAVTADPSSPQRRAVSVEKPGEDAAPAMTPLPPAEAPPPAHRQRAEEAPAVAATPEPAKS